jgi:hypothetical protein
MPAETTLSAQREADYAALVKLVQQTNAKLRMLSLEGHATMEQLYSAMCDALDPVAQWLIDTRDYPGKPAPRPVRTLRAIPFTDDGHTYWNGERTPARRVRVIVGPSPRPTWWCAGLAGTEREAVEVRYGEQPPFYLDNENGSGWAKVTIGRGSPEWGHSGLPVERVLNEEEPG